MAWRCQINGEEVGPVSPEQWSRLVADRRITARTLVRRDGMTGWRTLRSITGGEIPNTPPDHRIQSCAECGSAFPDEDLFRYGGARICAGCKPAYLQRLREGAPPSASNPKNGVHATERHLIVQYGASAPNRCVLCNEPADWSQRQAYYWHPPWILLSLLATPAAFIVVAMIWNRSLSMDLHLCGGHARRRWRRLVFASVWGFAGVSLIATSLIAYSRGLSPTATFWLLVVGIVSALSAPLYAQRALRVLLPRRIDGNGAVLHGASPEFLSSLPPWTGGPV